MPEFALIFRSSRILTSDELPIRNRAARDWALELQRTGTLRFAAPLEERTSVVGGEPPAPVADASIASVLIIQAADFERAVALAKAHPGLAFGTRIEVRPLKAVNP